MNYANITSLMKVKNKAKQTQFKPKQTQFKPNSRKAKIDAKCVLTREYEENCEYGPKKTNPKQTQFKPNFFKGRPGPSSLSYQNNDVIIRRIIMKNGL